MLAMGVQEADAIDDLKRQPPQRDRSEYLWQIKNRLFAKAGIGEKNDKPEQFSGIKEFVARQEELNGRH